ncbi:MAG: hypothetical protein HQL01_10035 [Nitrospirae bacterium]|nr:hypothetical protein [Nitrospirota bacterium]
MKPVKSNEEMNMSDNPATVTVIVYPGFTYKDSITYASEAARMLDSVLNIRGVVPAFGITERAALSMYEFGPHNKVEAQAIREAEAFFDSVKGFCKLNGIEAEFTRGTGTIEDAIEEIEAEAPGTNMIIIVPMPTNNMTHIAYSDERDYRLEKTNHAPHNNCNVVLVI